MSYLIPRGWNRLATELHFSVLEESMLISPRRFCALALTCTSLYIHLPHDLWARCLRFWFGNLAVPDIHARRRLYQLVDYFSRSHFKAARTICKEFSYHPTINYAEHELVAEFEARFPNTDIQYALVLAAPFFAQQAALTNDKYNETVQHYRMKEASTYRYRQLYKLSTWPQRCPNLDAGSPIVSIFLATLYSNKPSMLERGLLFFTKSLPGYKRRLDAVVAATRRESLEDSTRSIPFCLPCMAELKARSPEEWLECGLRNIAGSKQYPAGLANVGAGLGSSPDKLRGATHLQHLFDTGANGQDIVLLIFHPGLDPMAEVEDWCDVTNNLTPGSSIGYCLPADLSVSQRWNTAVFGNNSLDYVITVRLETLRLIKFELAQLAAETTVDDLGDLLFDWLLSIGVDAAEAQRYMVLVERSEGSRRGGAVYRGSNTRCAGESLPPRYALDS
ncbi:hypothetical protein C8R43DRAFT_1170397 [Mycena crocata]|nr:hypothetical protein C8R43DRAFT_1170397 [Mycena crocata]